MHPQTMTIHCSHITGNKLTLDDLGCVLEEVLDVTAQWYSLGLQLKVRATTLDTIRVQFLDAKRQLLETLKVWLTTSENTSWMTLTDALKSRSVGACQLAGTVETKYCLVEGTEVDSGMDASDSQPETNVTTPPLIPEHMVPSNQPGVVQMQDSKWNSLLEMNFS